MAAINVRTATLIYVITSIVFLVSLYNNIFRGNDQLILPSPSNPKPYIINPHISVHDHRNQLIHEQPHLNNHTTHTDDNRVLNISSNSSSSSLISTVSILFPGWEVLVIVSPENTPVDVNDGEYFCLFDTKETSPAKPAWILPSPNRRNTFKCVLPNRNRRRLPFRQPVLTKSPENYSSPASIHFPEMLKWNYVVYDSLTTDDDVVLFVKGIINRQGGSREPTEFRCVFFVDDVVNGVRTAVTSSKQEVFRCKRPQLTSVTSVNGTQQKPIKVSLEIIHGNLVVPSIAYYTPERKLAKQDEEKSLLCACTMVYNVAKFLREWVIYHSKIGVEKFIFYDNGSDDDFKIVVDELVSEGYNVKTLVWLWPKTQEAGFSHSAVLAKDSCKWMMYIDVDEFVYSPNWSKLNSSEPSKSLLQSLLPQNLNVAQLIGEIMIGCYEFGPSNQETHPLMGVTQGYNCRKRAENRHKSIVLLDAIHDSLLNVIHHFILKDWYKVKRLNSTSVVVNHYKFQVWSEFKAKFRRRVSAYVVDWTQAVNPKSNDRTPGLGFSAIEPKGWTHYFCEVYDNGLRDWTRRWFRAGDLKSGLRMAWQR